MSDTTPRPDEPADDTTTTPPPPEDPATEAAADPTASSGAEPVPDEATPPPPPIAADEATPPPTPYIDEPPPPPAPGGAAGATPPPPPQQEQPAYGTPTPPPPTAYAAPQAQMTPQEERTWSVATHGITLAALLLSGGTLGFVAALVLYLVYRDRGPYIRANTANALNIQIITAIGALISFILMFVLIGFFTIVVVGIYAVVLHIIGMVKANNGEWWDPPLTPKFVR